MESTSGPLSSAKATRSGRKVRKTNDLLFFSFNASAVEKEDENIKPTSSKHNKQNLPRLEFDESGKSDKGSPFLFKEVQKISPPPVPKNKRKIVKAKRVLRSTKQCELEDKCNDETLDLTTKSLKEKSSENSVNLVSDGEGSSRFITVTEKMAQDGHVKKENKHGKTPKVKRQSGKGEFSSFRDIEDFKSLEEPSENCKSVNLSPLNEDEGSSSYIEVNEKSTQDGRITEKNSPSNGTFPNFVASSKTPKTKKQNLSSLEADESGKGKFSSFREIEDSKSFENCKSVNLSPVNEDEGSSSYIEVQEKTTTEKISPTIDLPKFNFVASTAKKEKKSETSKDKKQNVPVIELDESGSSSEESFSFKEIENSAKHCEENDETFNVETSNSYLDRKPIKQPSENCKSQENDSNVQSEQLISKIGQTTVSEQLSEKKESFGSNLIVSLLPSPISPSTQSLKDEAPPYLSVHSAEDPIQPSLNGSSDETSIRRRTYELENSVNDISLLKSVSGKDGTKSSLGDDNSEEYVTPQVMFSKVTQRKRWNKVNTTPFQIKGSPRWISSPRPSTSKSTPGVTKPRVSPKLKNPKLSAKKPLSNVKVPNFAAIHKRAMDRVESIVEYKQRKEERAKMLISGKKPQKQAEKPEKVGRKQLRFAPDTAEKDKSMTFIPLPSTPLPKGVKKNFDESLASENEEEIQPPVFKFPKPTFAFETKIRSPVFKFTKPTFTSEERSALEKKINNLASHIPRMQKTNFGFLRREANDERRALVEKNCNINKFGISNPFHSKSAKAQVRLEEIKSVATKSKPVKNTLEARKCTIKGVRSNRRFELLMNMRKGK
ncbi:hypothetical protein TcasGA2_TC009999 [Tribolium castaneum]|uniref:Uncharacterized protein n=2 Tax=Tribolium castaneum TaxID=7070 RepID=D6WR67_TRICA|nr:hypothetical protein TcasGA2_TC009999 [Tribolium castaneum]